MQAVVPAAGEGTRLQPLTNEKPKGLVDVAGKPLLTRCFDQVCALGVDEIVVVVGYRAGDIIQTYGDAYDGVPLRYVHQREQAGLAHALLQTEPWVEGDFVLLNGDNVFEANVQTVLDRHQEREAAVTALVDRVSPDEATRTGVFAIEDGSVTGMVEKATDPPSTLASAGCYAFSPDVFDACRLVRPGDTGEYELSDAVNVLVAAGAQVELVELEGWRINVNTPEDRQLASERVR